MPQFERNAVRGGLSSQEVADQWRQAKDYTYKRLNVET